MNTESSQSQMEFKKQSKGEIQGESSVDYSIFQQIQGESKGERKITKGRQDTLLPMVKLEDNLAECEMYRLPYLRECIRVITIL